MRTPCPDLAGRRLRHANTLLCAAALYALATAPAHATLINYQNFDNLSAFTLNGATAGINTGGRVSSVPVERACCA